MYINTLLKKLNGSKIMDYYTRECYCCCYITVCYVTLFSISTYFQPLHIYSCSNVVVVAFA